MNSLSLRGNPDLSRHQRQSRCQLCRLILLCLIFLLPSQIRPAVAQSAPGTASPGEIHSEVRQILGQSEFHPSTAPSRSLNWLSEQFDKIGSFVKRQWDNLWAFLRRLFRVRMGVTSGVGEVLVYVFIVLFLIGIGWLIARIARTWTQRTRSDRHSATVSVDSEEAEEAIGDPDGWLQQARQFAEQRDYRRAFRAVFIATLLLLDRSGAIEYERSRTNGEYLRLLRGRGLRAFYEALQPLSTEFDQHWYGDRQTQEADYRRCLQSYQAMVDLAGTLQQGRTSGYTTTPLTNTR